MKQWEHDGNDHGDSNSMLRLFSLRQRRNALMNSRDKMGSDNGIVAIRIMIKPMTRIMKPTIITPIMIYENDHGIRAISNELMMT